jgi:hypothetical protein
MLSHVEEPFSVLPSQPLAHMLARSLILFAAFGVIAHKPIEGSYVAQTMNGHSLPSELRIPVQAGDVRLFRLEQGVLHLSSSGKFTLYFRYYHQLVRRGTRPTSTPVMSDSETGTYTLQNGKLMLTPTRKHGENQRPPIAATITGDDIRASYTLQDARVPERVTLLLRRDASFW